MTKCLALLLCLFVLPALAQEDIHVGVELQPYQPYSDVENGEYRGYARDLLDAFAAEYGYRFMKRHSYDPAALASMFRKLSSEGGLMSSHPGSEARAGRIDAMINLRHPLAVLASRPEDEEARLLREEAGPAADGETSEVTLAVSTVIFALGETIWSPTAPALINSIAPDHLRGRYNSAQSLTWSLGATLAPLASGALIGAGRGVTWALLIAVGCFAAAAFAQTLRPMLTPSDWQAIALTLRVAGLTTLLLLVNCFQRDSRLAQVNA